MQGAGKGEKTHTSYRWFDFFASDWLKTQLVFMIGMSMCMSFLESITTITKINKLKNKDNAYRSAVNQKPFNV